jgi:hypothetical protein
LDAIALVDKIRALRAEAQEVRKKDRDMQEMFGVIDERRRRMAVVKAALTARAATAEAGLTMACLNTTLRGVADQSPLC